MITLSQTAGTSGETTITISATSRSEMDDFVKKYTLANQTKSTLLAVTQKGYVPEGKYISFKPASFTFDSSGGTGSLQVSSDDDWYIDFGSWITPRELIGNGNTIVGISVNANTGDTRSGSITGYCLSNSAITASTSVSQSGSYIQPTLSVSPLKTAVNASGGTGLTLTVNSNQDWNAYTDARWLTLDTISGSGNGNISFDVLENDTEIEREANINVISTASSLSAVSVVAQSAQTQEEPYIIVSPTTKTVGLSGGSFTVTVSSNTEWDTAVYVDAGRSCITLDKLNGEGDDVVEVRVDAETQETPSGRTGYISFYNTKENLKAEVNISQEDVSPTVIRYQTTNNSALTPNITTGWGANIVSNTYDVNTGGSITFDGQINQIPDYAFNEQRELASINIPISVETIGDGAFNDCWSLNTVDIDTGRTKSLSVGFYSFRCGVKYINNMEAITSYGIASIPAAGIYSINIGDIATSIPSSCFVGCVAVTGITIGLSVASIGDNGFGGLVNCHSIYSKPTTCPTLGSTVFNDIKSTGTLHYPQGSDYSAMIAALPSGWTAVDDL